MQPLSAPDHVSGTTSNRFPDAAAESSAHLPAPLTSFVGRERDIANVIALVNEPRTRLVTLTGPGGVGKTRLALRVAEEIAKHPQREIVFVPLAAVADADLVVTSIGIAFHVPDSNDQHYQERLAGIIADRNVLLILDNFERVVDAAPLLTGLLSRCRLLTMLVTSRVLLRVSGEYDYAVRPLDLPAQDAGPAAIEHTSSVRLFLDRMGSDGASVAGDVSPSEMTAIAEICRRLDGLPLAIELAAARSRVLSAAGLLERLEDGTALLRNGPRDAPARLRSMHDAVAWSYELLTIDEQLMFRVLSVFSGGFTLEAAEALFDEAVSAGAPCASDPTLLALDSGDLPIELVLSLVQQSLVVKFDTGSGQRRFTMLETIREFGRERLSAAAEDNLVRNLHAAWFANRIDRIDPDPTHLALDSSPDPLAGEHDNLRAAITWVLEHGDGETAARLACGLWPFLARHGQYSEARAMLQNVLGAPGLNDPVLRACSLLYSAKAAWCQGDFQDCRELAAQALILCREINYQAGIAASLFQMGDAALTGDLDQAIFNYRETLAVSRDLDDAFAVARALDGLGGAMMYAGDYAAAKAAYTEHFLVGGDPTGAKSLFNPLAWVALAEGDFSLAEELARDAAARSRQMGVTFTQACSLRLLARATFYRNQLVSAADAYRQALSLSLQIGSHHESGYCVAELAAVAQACGESERAVRWLGFEEAQRARQRLGLTPDETKLRDTTRELALADLGESRFSEVWDEGQRLAAGAIFAEAGDWQPGPLAPVTRSTSLTRRELEVLQLLSRGLTNRDIANSLFLGTRTIDTHVSNLIAKLGVDSRHAAVREAQDRGLISR